MCFMRISDPRKSSNDNSREFQKAKRHEDAKNRMPTLFENDVQYSWTNYFPKSLTIVAEHVHAWTMA